MSEKIEFKFDTQLLISGENLDEDEIFDYISKNIKGDSLLAVGDDELIKVHYHTNEPRQVLEYGQSIGDIHDIIVENMQRQSDGLDG
ncbi:MAG: kinase to dihydroxyacetone kinase [Peptoniphilaceae bacterium]|nr:kinase to dihydroxyacetone kinase [Peptoniphilaceae bacterium]MDD7383048.1 kinase to dihydroxyacetone kinase [Peptoniphilaceae bacterium]MDY3737556.1 kinase to dihydroxyacetone kinase [Peptoniphilaceae bacterium]